jgi:transcriptional regulator with XRE-family HTH domain
MALDYMVSDTLLAPVTVESIKRKRKALRLSLTDVATRADLHREAIARLEHPDSDPRASSLVKLAKAMGVPVCELFEESGHGRRRR